MVMGGILIKKGTYFLNNSLTIDNNFILISGENKDTGFVNKILKESSGG
jgi:hypothetical protein